MKWTFRFDLFIAVCALLISTIAALASVFQTRAIQDQYAAAIWPYLSVDSTVTANGVKLQLINDGLGPALIRSAQLYLDGRPVPGWEEAMRMIFNDQSHAVASADMSSINASTTIRPGDSHPLLSITLSKGVPIAALLRHEVAIDVCYCSLNERCWTLRSVPGGSSDDYPQPVSHCTVGARITAARP